MSNKLQQLKAGAGANAAASIGVSRAAPRLLGAIEPPSDPRKQGVTRAQNAMTIRLDRITRDEDQPREDFDPESLSRLAESLRTRGQLQPIRVRWDEGRGVYVILCGERRWRAAKMAGMETIACVVHEGEVDVLAVQLIENALRDDLKPIEQARAFKALVDRNGWEYQQLAAELAISGSVVSRSLALLNLPDEIQERVEQGALAPSKAYEVSKLGDPVEQAVAAEAIEKERLTRSEAADLVKAIKTRRPAPDRKPEPVAVDLGDYTVTVRWKRPSPVTAPEALREALAELELESP